MDTNLLRAFLTVADCEGFSAAAGLLNRTQSAVSLQIRRLEERTGETLFERTSRSVRLTAAGARLCPYALQMLQLQEKALEAMEGQHSEDRIRLGISEEQAAAYLPKLLPYLPRDVSLDIVCDDSSSTVEDFHNGDLDVALALRHAPTSTGKLLGYEHIVWVAGAGFDPNASEALPLALNPDGCIFRASAIAALGRVGQRWRDRYISLSPTGVNAAVQAGPAATVKTTRSVPADCHILGAESGLPDLGHVEVDLHASPARLGDAFQAFVANLERVVSESQTLDSRPPARLFNFGYRR